MLFATHLRAALQVGSPPPLPERGLLFGQPASPQGSNHPGCSLLTEANQLDKLLPLDRRDHPSKQRPLGRGRLSGQSFNSWVGWQASLQSPISWVGWQASLQSPIPWVERPITREVFYFLSRRVIIRAALAPDIAAPSIVACSSIAVCSPAKKS